MSLSNSTKGTIVSISTWGVYFGLILIPFVASFYCGYLLSDNSPIKPGFWVIQEEGWPLGIWIALASGVLAIWCFVWMILGLYVMEPIGNFFSWLLRIPKEVKGHAKV